jgi:hypothetical protein
MDSYQHFVVIRGERTLLKLHKKEADLLQLYFGPELERAIHTFEKKYQFRLPGPVILPRSAWCDT